MNQAKRLKVETEKDFASESSSDEDNNQAEPVEESDVLNVEFEGESKLKSPSLGSARFKQFACKNKYASLFGVVLNIVLLKVYCCEFCLI